MAIEYLSMNFEFRLQSYLTYNQHLKTFFFCIFIHDEFKNKMHEAHEVSVRQFKGNWYYWHLHKWNMSQGPERLKKILRFPKSIENCSTVICKSILNFLSLLYLHLKCIYIMEKWLNAETNLQNKSHVHGQNNLAMFFISVFQEEVNN